MQQKEISIDSLVKQIESGDVRLPEMQRAYVWKSTQVRDLLDSLYRAYPSGTILTWETDEAVPLREFAVEQAQAPTRYQLLLDGQQRLTSLSAILRGEPVSVANRKRPIDVLFNLDHPEDSGITTEVDEDETADDADEEDADSPVDSLAAKIAKRTFLVADKKTAALPNWVSVTEVFRNPENKPFLQKAGVSGWDDPKYELYDQRLKRLRAIADYPYRVNILERDKSYEEVTEIFVRVNSLGARLRASDLALAQITATWRDSLKIFQEYQADCEKRGFPIDMSIPLKTLMAMATNQSKFGSVARLDQPRLEDAWSRATQGIDYALNFLSSNVRIDSPALLSSPYLIIALAYLADKRGYHFLAQEEAELRYWTLMANAKGRYSRGSSESLLNQDLAALRDNAGIARLIEILSAQMGRLTIEPSDLFGRNSRSSLFKTMFLAFRDAGAKDWQDQLSIAFDHSGAKHKLQFHHIFPHKILEDAGKESREINEIGNLVFIGGRTNRRIHKRPPSEYLPEIVESAGEAALADQCVPLDRELWKLENYPEFVKARYSLIADRLNEYVGQPGFAS